VDRIRERERLALAIAAIRQKDRARARELIYAVLDKNPRNATAWSWACEVATTKDERIRCLKQILAINPSHNAARRYLAQLQNEVPATRIPAGPVPPHTVAEDALSQGSKARVDIADLLFLPLEWVFRLSLTQLLVVLLALVLAGGIVYFRANTSFLGLAGLDFDTLTISDSYDQIAADDLYWKITFESRGTSEFSGIVRHVSPFRMGRLRILTHDILVTSGDYADPDVVSTSVFNHLFTWRSSSTAHPSGRINLLHTVPANEEIYRQLLEIRSWDVVVITGREVLKIEAYDQDGNHLGGWRDTGCNTLLVESVSIVGR
jgi:hypothetical protein